MTTAGGGHPFCFYRHGSRPDEKHLSLCVCLGHGPWIHSETPSEWIKQAQQWLLVML